jgi:pimeloyl-ACP methyl ester carboxylesterase
MPNSKLLIFEQGGHGLYWEVPDQFNQAVLDFVGSIKIK